LPQIKIIKTIGSFCSLDCFKQMSASGAYA